MIKALQRDNAKTQGKVYDLSTRLAQGGGTSPRSGVSNRELEDSSFSQSRGGSRQGFQELSHLMLDDETSGRRERASLERAVSQLRLDCQSWLEGLRQSIVHSLEGKADSQQVSHIAEQLRQSANLMRSGPQASISPGDTAAFARRPLFGRCCACDATLAAEAMEWDKPTPMCSQGLFPSNPSRAVPNAIRPPGSPGHAKGPTHSPSKLPKLSDFRREFPQGRILRQNKSEPRLGAGPRRYLEDRQHDMSRMQAGMTCTHEMSTTSQPLVFVE